MFFNVSESVSYFDIKNAIFLDIVVEYAYK